MHASDKLKDLYGNLELTFEQYLDFRILDFHNQALCRFVRDFETWDKTDTSESFYENFGEYLMKRASMDYDAY